MTFFPSTTIGLAGSLALAATVALVLLLAYRLHTTQTRFRLLSKLLYNYWSAYLETISLSLQRYRSLRAVLANVHPLPEEKRLNQVTSSLYQAVRLEINSIEEQLDDLLNLPDDAWHTVPIRWRPIINVHRPLLEMVELIRAGIPPDRLEAMRQKWTEEVSRQYRRKISQLEKQIRELKGLLRTAEEKSDKKETRVVREPSPDEEQKLEELQREVEALRERLAEVGAGNEEAIAARYMSELQQNLKLEETDVALAKAEGELNYARNQLQELSDQGPDDREKMEGHVAWMEQVQRWWKIQRRLRKQALLLDEAVTDDESPGEDGDIQSAYDFQNMEQRAVELRSRIASLTTENKQLTQQLETFDSEKADLEKTRAMLHQVEAQRNATQRELSNLEQMIDQMEKDLLTMRGKAKRSERLEKELDKEKEKVASLNNQLVDTKREKEQLEIMHSRRERELENSLKMLEDKASSGQVDGMVPEEEVIELQQEYDKVNAQIVQHKAARVRSEKAERQALEEVEKVRKEHNSLLAKYRDLKEQFQAAMQENK